MIRLYFDEEGFLRKKQLLKIEREDSIPTILTDWIWGCLGMKRDYEEVGGF